MPARRSDSSRTIDAHVGARLRLLRELRGLSQGELADRLGLKSRQAVAAYEAGDAISASVMFRLTSILQVDLHQFFDGLGAPSGHVAEEAAEPSPQAAKIAALLARTPPTHHAAILKVVRAMAESLAGDGGSAP